MIRGWGRKEKWKKKEKKEEAKREKKVSTVRAAAQAGLISILIAYVLYGEALYAYRVRTVRWGLAVRSCLVLTCTAE